MDTHTARTAIRSATAAFVALVVLLGAVVAALVIAGRPAGASVEHATWTHRDGHWPTVYVENDISAAHSGWGVRQAVETWGSGLHYGHCRADAGCARIASHDDGRGGYIGITNLCETGRRFCPMTVEMNWTYGAGMSAAKRHEATLHELGHVLGLGHDSRGGVMCPCDPGTLTISGYERAELRRIYAHNGTRPKPVRRQHPKRLGGTGSGSPILHLG